MSTLKADAVTAAQSNTSITVKGLGSGVVKLGDGELKFPDADGSANEMIITNGSAQLSFTAQPSAGFTLATEQATTSGDRVTFGSIPSGMKMIVISFDAVGADGVDHLQLTLGDSGGLETAGYISSVLHVAAAADNVGSATAYFRLQDDGVAARTYSGSIILSLEDASNFTWGLTGGLAGDTTIACISAGGKSLSAELTQVSIYSGGDDFDAGAINIMYQ